MKKLNLICASIALLAVGGANAGNLAAVNTKFATEIFGAATDATTSVTPGAATYTVTTTNGVVINANGVIYLTLRLANGTFAAAPASGTITGSVLDVGGPGNGSVGVGSLSADKTTVVYPITFAADATLGVGSTLIYTPAAGNVVGVKDALAAGGTVTISAGLSSITASGTPGNSTAAIPADIDGPAVSTTFATGQNGITVTVSVPTTFDAKIDVTTPVPNTQYAGASTTTAALAQVTVAQASTPAKLANGTTDLTLAAYAGLGAKVDVVATPNSGASFPVAASGASPIGRVLVSSGTSCAAPVATTALLTSTTAIQAQTLTVNQTEFAAANVAGTATFTVCQGTAGGAAITPITPTISATSTPATALTNFATDTASGTGYALTYNGAVVDTVGYFPAGLSVFGYTTFTRIINTGSNETPISVAFIPQNTGVVGSTFTLTLPAIYVGNTLKPGASVTLPNTAIEAVLGTLGSADRPRLRVQGQTSSLKVQQFVQAADGTFTEVGGSQP